MIKKIINIILIASVLVSFSACDNGTADPLAPSFEGVYSEPTTNNEPTSENEEHSADSSWKSNYSLKYIYTNNGNTYYINEMRTGNEFMAVDTAKGDINYYIAIGDTTVYNYILYPDTMTGTYSIEPVIMNNLVSKFMELSTVQPVFTSLSNVELVETENIIDRPATKYKQTEKNDDGEILGYADVWIDNEFGFAIKCHICLADGTIKESWEAKEFTAGGITPADLGIDITKYAITSQ